MRWDRSGEGKEVRGIGELKMDGVVEVAIEVGLASRVVGEIWVLSKVTEGTGVAILELEVDNRAMEVIGAMVERRVMVETGVQGQGEVTAKREVATGA